MRQSIFRHLQTKHPQGIIEEYLIANGYKNPSPVEEWYALPDKRRAVPLLCNKASWGGGGKELLAGIWLKLQIIEPKFITASRNLKSPFGTSNNFGLLIFYSFCSYFKRIVRICNLHS